MDVAGNPVGGTLPLLEHLAVDGALAAAAAAMQAAPIPNPGTILDLSECGLTGTLPTSWMRVPRVLQMHGFILKE